MIENNAFQYMGKIDNFNLLLQKVLELTEEDWNKYKKRNSGVAAEYSDTIPLIYDPKLKINSVIKHENYETFSDHLIDVIKTVSLQFGSIDIKQAMLTRLRSRTEIKRHKDVGPITQKTHRIHVPILTNEDCIFTIENESRNLKSSEIWLIDNTGRYHSVINNGTSDRVHLIIDAI